MNKRNRAQVRLMRDYEEIQNDPPYGISASPTNMDDLFMWDAMISGPDDSPWEGGMFALQLRFSEDYPSVPPIVRFATPIFHPNVFSDGMVCLDIIKDKWSPVNTVSMILTSIQSLLNDPNPNSPANSEAASLYVNNIREYKRRVRECAERSLQMNSCFVCSIKQPHQLQIRKANLQHFEFPY
ncbi:uncharacterized protein [Blastocystis hominis]|uniref:UBC core domain-containing protein n=1 Tax=Blastocystis hominis TaxID=12968 RepID=D8LZF1_BLAHO|nr:uncharacterized protein [Blastocystis hominis]CBK21190.2 unnamed protein product [Blastocystis hominis]|eukprot:XP_012895238.1 uncharacterized protein [Blastocystis hominis]